MTVRRHVVDTAGCRQQGATSRHSNPLVFLFAGRTGCVCVRIRALRDACTKAVVDQIQSSRAFSAGLTSRILQERRLFSCETQASGTALLQHEQSTRNAAAHSRQHFGTVVSLCRTATVCAYGCRLLRNRSLWSHWPLATLSWSPEVNFRSCRSHPGCHFHSSRFKRAYC